MVPIIRKHTSVYLYTYKVCIYIIIIINRLGSPSKIITAIYLVPSKISFLFPLFFSQNKEFPTQKKSGAGSDVGRSCGLGSLGFLGWFRSGEVGVVINLAFSKKGGLSSSKNRSPQVNLAKIRSHFFPSFFLIRWGWFNCQPVVFSSCCCGI